MSSKKSILLNIDEKLKKELEKEANEKMLPLTSYIRMILIERKR